MYYMNNKYDDDFILKMYKENLTGKSVLSLASEYGIGRATLQRRFKEKGFKVKKGARRHKGNIVYDDFFKNIDSEIKAYLLGFIAADGSVWKNSKSNSWTLQINVAMKDEYIIDLFIRYINPTGKKLRIKKLKGEDQVGIKIVSAKIALDLKILGIIPNKTYSEINTLNLIPEYLKIHFIRGFFDGDGTVGIYKQKIGKIIYRFKIISKKGKILTDIMKYLSLGLILTYISNRDIFELRINKLSTLKQLYDQLYLEASFFFRRKRNTFRKIKYYKS